MTIEDVRLALDQQLGVRVPEKVWAYLLKQGFPAEVAAGRQPVGWLSDRYWDLREVQGKPPDEEPRLVPRDRVERGDIQAAISLLVARHAGARDDVRGFRQRVLGGKLLSLEGVEAWIKKQAVKDGPATRWVRVPLETLGSGSLDPRRVGFEVDSLAYGVAGNRWAQHLPVAHGGVLAELRAMGAILERDYGWDNVAATLFVLTDRAPWVAAIKVKVTPKASYFNEGPHNRFHRGHIEMAIDPAVTPAELASAYRHVRGRILGGQRPKKLSDKHVRLAMFAASFEDGTSWPEHLKAWNRDHPKIRYDKSQLQNFKRDCRVAVERLLAPRVTSQQAFQWWKSDDEAPVKRKGRPTVPPKPQVKKKQPAPKRKA